MIYIYIIKILNFYTVMKECGLVVEKDIHCSHLTLIYKHFWIDNIALSFSLSKHSTSFHLFSFLISAVLGSFACISLAYISLYLT